MKKIFALLMALCMLLTAFAAIAEETQPQVQIRSVLQNEQAPAIVPTENYIAKICAADGTVLAQITEAGDLHLADVHHREELINTQAIDRLDVAYDQLMHDVHFGDVATTEDEEKLLKDLINEQIETEDFNAYDLLVYETFDVHVDNEELAKLLTDGAYLEFTIELLEHQSAPLMIKFSGDGEHWDLLENYSADGKQVTIRMYQEGVVGLIKPYEVIPGTTTTYAQAVMGEAEPSADAQDTSIFRPSVTGKPAPQLKTDVDENGEVVVGYIYTTVTTDPVIIRLDDHLVITPVADSAYVEDITTHEHLQWSYDSMLAAGAIDKLGDELDEKIDAQLADAGFDLGYEDLVMRDLFEITIYGDNLELFYDENNMMELTFEETEVKPGDALVVMHSFDSIEWHVAPAEQVTINDDGTVSVKLDGLGVVAFLVEKPETLPDADQAVSSPE